MKKLVSLLLSLALILSAITIMPLGASAEGTPTNQSPLLTLDIDADKKGVDIITRLILGHFAEGGTLININILDTDKLMAANKNPDFYPDLVVRVTGFTAYFASLSPEFRQLVVNRFLTNM